MNYFPFHIGDYLSATRHLSWEEDAAFRRLLDVYYTTEKPLPLEPRAVCRLVLATTDSQREAVAVVLAEFFVKTEEGWVNSRADTEIEAMRDKQQKQRDKANKRWHKPEVEHGNASAMPQQTEANAAASKSNADAMPPTPTPTPEKRKEKGAPPCVAVSVLVETGFSEELARGFIAHKAAAKAPLTDLAWADHLRESAKARWTPMAAAEKVMARSWKGFEAKYVANESTPAARAGPAQTFRERDAEIAAARVSEMTGGLAAAKPIGRRADVLSEVFDAPPTRRLG